MGQSLAALRTQMKQHGVDAYLIPTGDFHGSEVVGKHFQCREYVSGFTGSAGTLLVLKDWAGLWTDGRYFIQAENQLKNSGITLMKMGQPGVPTVEQFLADNLTAGQRLGFDGRCISAREGLEYRALLECTGAELLDQLDLVGEIWSDRPPLSAEAVWELPLRYCGLPREDKITVLRAAIAEEQADVCLVTALDEIAWLFNLRGGDVSCCPVVLSYLAVTAEDVLFFVNSNALPSDLRASLEQSGVTFHSYDEVYTYAENLPSGSTVLLDGRKASCALVSAIPDSCLILDCISPTEIAKSIKNSVEIKNVKSAHLRDGIALTRFMYWLKHNVGKKTITELSAAQYLEELRGQSPLYLGPSFSPILAYGSHGAIVHYSATPESDIPLAPEGYLLTDTGGHYWEGTTDCTRTFALGSLTRAQKTHYTAVLRGLLNLADAQFPYGCTGAHLDCLARKPLWEQKLDYNHGTGHGVGYLLNVHEGPQNIRWRTNGGAGAVLEPGMITSDEPGVYLSGQYGIRLENLLLCVNRGENEFGQFLGFEHLTLVPFDPDAIDPAQMSSRELSLLNKYHAHVYSSISPFLTEEERNWLKTVTQPLS